MPSPKRTPAVNPELTKRMLTGVALWMIVAALCAFLANAVAAGLPVGQAL